jgi:hypothetical protein
LFLQAIASSFPHLLADSVDTMLGLLEEDSDLLKDAGTQLLAKVGSQLNPANGEARCVDCLFTFAIERLNPVAVLFCQCPQYKSATNFSMPPFCPCAYDWRSGGVCLQR